MNQLKCTTINCQHNLKDHCNAGVINVTDSAVCGSKIKRAGGALEQTFAEIEASEEFLADAPNVVTCDAECLYNKERVCSANSLLIADSIFRTRCKTRIKP